MERRERKGIYGSVAGKEDDGESEKTGKRNR